MNAHSPIASPTQREQNNPRVSPMACTSSWTLQPTLQEVPAAWALHLSPATAQASAPGNAQPPQLSAAEAARVQRHCDRLMAALQTQDRTALPRAKGDVLEDAYCTRTAPQCVSAAGGCDATARTADSPALRRALRDLSWRMAALLIPRSPRR